MEKYLEITDKIPMQGNYDVIVAGGGPAGVCASLAAARSGASVLLIEKNGCLGGIWTAGALSWVLDAYDKNGIIEELIKELTQRGSGRIARDKIFISDVEQMKLLLEEKLLKANVDFLLHTRLTDAVTENGVLRYVITDSKSGKQAWSGKVFIDCSGDGDLGAMAGCRFEEGKSGTEETQPMSLVALLSGVESKYMKSFDNTLPYGTGKTPKQNLLDEFMRCGVKPSYTLPALYHMGNNVYMLVANHEYGYKATDAKGITKATVNARREINTLVNALKESGGIWENIQLVATAENIGVREGRRIEGIYRICENDLYTGATFEDAVCHINAGMDIHATKKSVGSIEKNERITHPYDIPLRALVAKDVKALMMAGRCISGDFKAHSSYRMSGSAAAMGEAAGKAAAWAAANGKYPHEISKQDFEEIYL